MILRHKRMIQNIINLRFLDCNYGNKQQNGLLPGRNNRTYLLETLLLRISHPWPVIESDCEML